MCHRSLSAVSKRSRLFAIALELAPGSRRMPDSYLATMDPGALEPRWQQGPVGLGLSYEITPIGDLEWSLTIIWISDS